MRSHCSILDARALGLAAGTVAATISGVCALALMVAPDGTRALIGYLIHSDLSGLSPAVSWTSFFIGVIGWGLLAGLAFSGAAGLYNRFSSAAGVERHAAVHGVA